MVKPKIYQIQVQRHPVGVSKEAQKIREAAKARWWARREAASRKKEEEKRELAFKRLKKAKKAARLAAQQQKGKSASVPAPVKRSS
jgi:hypothetical protein